MRIVTIKCPNCGSALEVSDQLKSAQCNYCGSRIVMDWSDPAVLSAHLEQGWRALRAGQFEVAHTHFIRAVEQYPTSHDAHFWKGVTAALRGQLEEAEEARRRSALTADDAIERVATLFSGLPEAMGKALLRVCSQADYFPTLREIFLGAAERLAPSQAARYYLYGLTEQAIAAGRFDKAEAYLERALQLDPKQSADITGEVSWLGYSYLAHGYIGLANRAGDVLDFERAAIYLERALGIDPQQKAEVVGSAQLNEHGKPTYLGYIGLAWLATNAAKFEHATKFLERALQLDSTQQRVIVGQWPQTADTHDAMSFEYGYLGLAYHALQHGQLAQAAAALERVLQLAPQQQRLVIGQQRADTTDPAASYGYWSLAYRALQASDVSQAVAYLLRLKQLDKRLSLAPVAQWAVNGKGYIALARVAKQLNDDDAVKKYLHQYGKLGYKREAQALAHELGVKLGRL